MANDGVCVMRGIMSIEMKGIGRDWLGGMERERRGERGKEKGKEGWR